MALAHLPVLALVSGLTVETGSPDALCPDVASTEEAIHARLGELEAEGANWRVHYTIGHAPDASSGDFVRLVLTDPNGVKRLSRDLPMAGESCSTMAQVIALVVDRFFRTMVAEREEQPKSSHPPAKPPALRDGGVSDTKPERPSDGQAFALAAQLGMVGMPLSPTVGLGLTRQWKSFSLSSALTWVVLSTTEDLDRGGQAHSQSGILRVVPSWDLTFESVRVALGATLAATGEWGSTTGLAEPNVGFRTLLSAGGSLAVRVSLADRSMLELSGIMEAPFRPFGGEFVIDGEEVLKPPPVRGLVSVGFGPAWFW